MKYFISSLFLFFCLTSMAQKSSKDFVSIFNGKNLNGWHSFLKTKGVNYDPEAVFKVENNLLHISGKEFGYIMTDKVYENFDMIVEFKWGTKKFPPRDADTTKRDNGILFAIPPTTIDKVWPGGVECQIQERDLGDIWLIDSATVEIDGRRTPPTDYYRVMKKADGELPTGQWNKVEIIVNNGDITYFVNGIKVNDAKNPSRKDGRILVQSEGAEIFYRTIKIKELKKGNL